MIRSTQRLRLSIIYAPKKAVIGVKISPPSFWPERAYLATLTAGSGKWTYQRSRTDKSGSQVQFLHAPRRGRQGHIEILLSLAKLGSSGRVGASKSLIIGASPSGKAPDFDFRHSEVRIL